MPQQITSPQADQTLLGLTPRGTALSSRAIKATWDERIKAAAIFSARTTKESYLDMVRKGLAAVASGVVTPQVAETKLKGILQNLGYRPETGFPDEKTGIIPPARPGAITDLSSSRRIQLILDTNVKQARSLGQVAASENPIVLMTDPAWRLTRTGARKKPRGDWKVRWKAAGDACGWHGAAKTQFVALKTSPIWQHIADGTGGFEDTLGSPYPPFAFGSGMAWVNVSRKDWQRICQNEGIPDLLDEIAAKAKQLKARDEGRWMRDEAEESDEKARRSAPNPEGTRTPPRELRRDVEPPRRIFAEVETRSAMEAKERAVRGIREAIRNVQDVSVAISRRYIAAAGKTLERMRENGADGTEEVEAAIGKYRKALGRLAEYETALRRIARTVDAAEPGGGRTFEDRMGRFLAASGRYESYALDIMSEAKRENAKVAEALRTGRAQLGHLE